MTTEIRKSGIAGNALKWLILMRHAKSDWGNESLSDHDRPLNDRGCRDGPRMGMWIRDIDCVPDLILTSSAMRTCQTVARLLPVWKSQPTVLTRESLYLASPGRIITSVVSEGGGASRILVVAHNPGISQLTSMLAGRPIEMPTAAAAVFQFQMGQWSELSADADAELLHFNRPKSL